MQQAAKLKSNHAKIIISLSLLIFWIISTAEQTATAAIDSTKVLNPTTTDRRICTRLIMNGSDINSTTSTFGMTNRSCIPVGVPGIPSGGSCDMMCQSAAVHDAGSGYRVGDVITLGGNYTSPCTFRVDSLNSATPPAGVASVSLVSQGRYAAQNVPSKNPVGQQSSTGGGGGVTLDVTLTTDNNSCSSGGGGGAGFGAAGVPAISFSGGGRVGVTCPSDHPYFNGPTEGIGSSLVWVLPPVWVMGIGVSGQCCASPSAPPTQKYSTWQTPDSSGNCPPGTGY